ncbi:MAG: helicase, partial [Anaeromyxobacteraceae bacterium]
APGARVPSRQASRYLDETPISVAIDLGEGHRPVSGLASAIEEEGGADEARVGAPPAALLEAARAVAEREAEEELARRRDAALARLAGHSEAEEERLVTAAFEGGAAREEVDDALTAVRQHRIATEAALRRARVELDAAALVVPAA